MESDGCLNALNLLSDYRQYLRGKDKKPSMELFSLTPQAYISEKYFAYSQN